MQLPPRSSKGPVLRFIHHPYSHDCGVIIVHNGSPRAPKIPTTLHEVMPDDYVTTEYDTIPPTIGPSHIPSTCCSSYLLGKVAHHRYEDMAQEMYRMAPVHTKWPVPVNVIQLLLREGHYTCAPVYVNCLPDSLDPSTQALYLSAIFSVVFRQWVCVYDVRPTGRTTGKCASVLVPRTISISDVCSLLDTNQCPTLMDQSVAWIAVDLPSRAALQEYVHFLKYSLSQQQRHDACQGYPSNTICVKAAWNMGNF